MTPLTVLMVSSLVLAAFVGGVFVGLRASRQQVRKAEADLMDGLYARHSLVEHVRFNREAAARMIA